MPPRPATAAAQRQRNRKSNGHNQPRLWTLQKLLLVVFGFVVGFTTVVPYFASVLYEDIGMTAYSVLPDLQYFQQQQQQVTKQKGAGAGADAGSTSSKTTETTEKVSEELPDYHVVFSTSCSDQQNWESYVFFYHARRVRQRGSVTRIASGCSTKEAEQLLAFHDKFIAPMALSDDAYDMNNPKNNSQKQLHQSFHLHLTPDFSRVRLSNGKDPYKYMNKPFGVRHWMESGLGLSWSADNSTITSSSAEQHQRLLDAIVILMDPDMILLRPIGHDFSDASELWVDGERPETTKVTHGHPIAQQDGYLSSEWMKLDSAYITQNKTLQRPDWNSGPKHWNTGPPYLATVADMFRIVSLWTETAPRTLDIYPKLFAEMYGFIWATVMLQLPFALTQSIVVSTTETTNREGWPMIDALDDRDICQVPVTATSYVAEADNPASVPQLPTLPVGLHYCKRYTLGKVSQSADNQLYIRKKISIHPFGARAMPYMKY